MSKATSREPEISVFRKWSVDQDTAWGVQRPWGILHKTDTLNGHVTQSFKTHAEAISFAHDLIKAVQA